MLEARTRMSSSWGTGQRSRSCFVALGDSRYPGAKGVSYRYAKLARSRFK